MWHITRAQGPASSAARIARRRGSSPFTPTTFTLSRTFTPRQNSGFAATARAQFSTSAWSMLSISGTGKPASPKLAMWTKAWTRVRACPATNRSRAATLLAPASPAETAVVVQVSGASSSGGMPMAEP